MKAVDGIEVTATQLYSDPPPIRPRDVLVSNSSVAINLATLRFPQVRSVYVASDQGDGPTDMLRFVEQFPGQNTGWETILPPACEYVVGTTGIRGLPGQGVLEIDGLDSPPFVPAVGKKAKRDGTKRIGLTWGHGTQQGTFTGVEEPLHKSYRWSHHFGMRFAESPTSLNETIVFERILDVLEKLFGHSGFELEIFTGNSREISGKLASLGSDRLKITDLLSYDALMNRMWSKDLIITNPGSTLVPLARLERKLPVILVDTDQRVMHNSAYSANINWFSTYQERVQTLTAQEIVREPNLLQAKIECVLDLSPHGPAKCFENSSGVIVNLIRRLATSWRG